MTQIQFYQVAEATPASADSVLPALLQKAYASGQPVLVVAPTAERALRLDEGLWGGLGNLGAESFLPHAKAGTPTDATQPILIAHLEDTPAPASLLVAEQSPRLPIILAGAEASLPALLAANPEKIFYIFTPAPHDTTRARTLYKTHKEAGHSVRYFAQTEGRWIEKS